MKRIGFKINEKLIGLLLAVLGLAGLGRALFLDEPTSANSLAHSPETRASAASAFDAVGQPAEPRTPCRVLTVFDGDTLGCDLNGDGRLQKPREQVRLLGVDSPEMHYSRKNPTYGSAQPEDEPFAKEASRWLTQQAQGKTVYLAFDVLTHDKYERTLAYVFATAKAQQSLNQQLLGQGYATVLFLGKNRRYQPEFEAAEGQARISQRGLWSTSR